MPPSCDAAAKSERPVRALYLGQAWWLISKQKNGTTTMHYLSIYSCRYRYSWTVFICTTILDRVEVLFHSGCKDAQIHMHQGLCCLYITVQWGDWDLDGHNQHRNQQPEQTLVKQIQTKKLIFYLASYITLAIASLLDKHGLIVIFNTMPENGISPNLRALSHAGCV